MPGAANRPEREHAHGWREPFEGARYDEIAERVVDDVDGYPLLCLRSEALFEGASNRIIFPKIGLEVDALAGVVNRVEHRFVEMLPVTIYLQPVVARGQFWQAQMRETTGRQPLRASSRYERKHGDERRLERDQSHNQRHHD